MADDDLILKRRPSAKSFIGWYLLLGIAAIACEVVAFTILSKGGAQLALIIAGPALLVIGHLMIYLIQISTQYRLFADRLEVESGLISKKIENVKLFRIRDIGLSQGVLGRMLGFGDVPLTSTDTSSPHTVIRGVDAPRELYDRISAIVSQTAAQRRTMIIEDTDAQANELNIQQ